MIARRLQRLLWQRSDEMPAVALLGPRQVGKTTLALALAAARPATCLDLESAADPARHPGPADLVPADELSPRAAP
jgi:predicted AAA+ superfamily ATPase